MPRMLAAFLFCLFVSSASAQVIYEPIRYQYGRQVPYYYGGNDRWMFRTAHWDRVEVRNGFSAAHGNVMTHREVSYVAPRVYTDHMPRGNGAIYGYTIDDARNDAYRNAPRYFHKRDLLSHAVQDDTGAWHVPAQIPKSQGGTVEIRPYVRPTTMPKTPVFIFPKDLLNKPLNPPKPVVASAG